MQRDWGNSSPHRNPTVALRVLCRSSLTDWLWLQTPYLYYRAAPGSWDAGRVHRIDYDNPTSLQLKSAYAKKVGARGQYTRTLQLLVMYGKLPTLLRGCRRWNVDRGTRFHHFILAFPLPLWVLTTRDENA